MKKLSLFMLMAVGLLISTQVWAGPKRPVPPAGFKSEGIEMPKLDFTKLPARTAKKAAANAQETYEASLNETKYATLEEAVAAAVDGDVIYVLGDIDRAVSISYEKEGNITIDLQGNYIDDFSAGNIVTINGNVTLQNGVVWTCYYLAADDKTEQTAIKVESGNVIFHGLRVSSYLFDSSQEEDPSFSTYWYGPHIAIDIAKDANVEIKGAKIYSYYGINSAGNTTIKEGTELYTYSGGEITGGILTIEDGTKFLTCSSYGIFYMYKDSEDPQMFIKGGEWKNTNAKAWSSCVYVANGKVFISGGTFETEGTSIIYSYGKTIITDGLFKAKGVVTSNIGTMHILGGTFVGDKSSEVCLKCFSTTRIIGGNFTGTQNGQGGTGLVNTTYYGYKEEEDSTFTAGPIIAKIGDAKYYSLQDAIDDAEDGAEITLFAHRVKITEDGDIAMDSKGIVWESKDTIDENIAINKTININLTTGKTLSGDITANEGAYVIMNGTGTFSGEFIANGGTFAVYGGTYTNNPKTYVKYDEGCKMNFVEEQGYVVTQEVAQIGSTKYSSFAAAIDAANEQTDAIVELLYNASMPTSILTLKKAMTIDLGGNTLYATNNNSYLKCQAIVEIKNGTITNAASATSHPEALINLANASANVTMKANVKNVKGSYAVKCSADNAQLTIPAAQQPEDNVVLIGKTAAIYSEKNIVLNNQVNLGELRLGNTIADITNSGTMTIYSSSNSKTLTLTNTGSLVIDKGIYMGTFNISEGSVVLNGGVYSPAIHTAEIEDSSSPKQINLNGKVWHEIKYQGNEAWQVLETGISAECEMDGIEYVSLRDLLSYIPNGAEKKITLLRDIDVEVTSANYYTISNAKKITLDLNGCVLSGDNKNVGGNCDFIYLDGDGVVLTIVDSKEGGKITYKGNATASQMNTIIFAYGGNSATLNLYGGTIENTTSVGNCPYAITMYPKSTVNIYGGKIYQPNSAGIRVRVYDNDRPATLNIEGGEIEAHRPIWVDINSRTSSVAPTVNFNMNGGALISTDDAIDAQSFYVTTFGGGLQNIFIDVTQGDFYGNFYLGGEFTNKAYGYENANIKGGTFNSHFGFSSFKRSAETQLYYIEGGAYFFDYTNNSSNHSFAEFCEYIKPGHYATIMCLNDDATGTVGTDYIEYQGHKFTFGPCSDDGKEFWAVIDALGPSKVDIITGGTKDEPVVLDPDNYKPIDEIVIDGGVVEVKSGDIIEVNRMQVGKDGNGAGVIVETDATLIVGLNGIQVDEASTTDDKVTYVIVEAGGTLETNGTIISNDVKEIIIESDEAHGLGSVLISPDVTYNNEPRATVYMATTAHHEQSNNTYYWQHFGIPCIGAQEGKDKPDINNPVAPAWTWDTQVMSYLNQWINNKWEGFTDPQILKVPFRGYNVTNESLAGGVNYIFKGFLIGNDNAVVKFTHLGYNVMGNSYTAPIDVLTMLDNLKSTYGDNIQGTVWIYQSATDNHISATLKELQEGEAEFKTIGAMQGFILKLDNGSVDQIGNINYRDAVWMNPNKAGIPLMAPKMSNEAKANIIISSASSYDKVKLYENSDYTSAFENGADAPKLMNNALNIYANTEVGQLTSMVSDNLEGTNLSITTGKETTYTLSFEKVNNMNYILRDMITNMDIVIVEGNTYEFTAPANATLENRFKLINPAYVPTDIEEQKTSVKSQGIYTTLGQYLGTEETWTNLSQGVYVINGVKVIK